MLNNTVMMCPLMYKSESFSYILRNAPAGSLGNLQMEQTQINCINSNISEDA